MIEIASCFLLVLYCLFRQEMKVNKVCCHYHNCALLYGTNFPASPFRGYWLFRNAVCLVPALSRLLPPPF